MQQKCVNMTTLYLVRHGETVDNVNQIMQGQTQGQLTENGIRQAREVRDMMAAEDFAAIISSDLKRSVDTAKIIAEPHHMKVVQISLLRERDWGSFTGRYIPELKGETWPDDIETLENLLSRAGEFIAYVKKTFPGKKVLAVGHGIVNKAIQAVYYGKQMSEVQKMTNAEVRILYLRPPKCPPPPPREPPPPKLPPPPREPPKLPPLLREPPKLPPPL